MTSAVLKPRDYQDQCKIALQDGWSAGRNNMAAVLPTGAGKTIVFAHLARDFFEQTGRRVLIEVHTDELAQQAYSKMRAVAPQLRVGIVKAWRNDVRADVVIGSVQTLKNARRLVQLKDIGLGVTDECHHATALSYRKIRGYFPDAQWCGVTATLIRGDGKGLGSVWDGGVAYRKSISWMIRHGLGNDGYTSIPVFPGYGYLLDVRGKRIEVDNLDLSDVKRSGGDYQRDSLGKALSRSLAPETVANAYAEYARDRSGVVFTPTVATAYEFAQAIAATGIKVEVIHGELGTEERRNILGRLEAGTTQVVCNCMVLTEGFDCRRLSCVVVARATRSGGLYQQMVGRGLRPFTDEHGNAQRDCLILDVVGASEEHGLASLVDLSEDITRRPRDGQSLAEAEDEQLDLDQQEALGGVIPDYRYRGRTVAVDFDPLARASKLTWSATTGGTWFLSAGDFYVFVMSSVSSGALAGTYDVLWTRKDRKFEHTYDGVTGFWGFTSHTGIPLDYAFAWGEEVAAELGGDPFALLIRKDKTWRRQQPTDAQLSACQRRGLTVPADATRGDVSVLLDTWAASQMIDPAVSYFQSQKEATNDENCPRDPVNV
jgi:superfamily II DNA or RNA helicase